ncbi:unnamed protein product [Rotaria socialis]
MAAVVSSYPQHVYHQQAYFNSKLSPFYSAQYIPSNFYKPKLQKSHKQQPKPRTPTPTKSIENIDSNLQQLRPRREPRIRRQVILLPTPEPIYRQVRHRLPTPERQVIQRTVIQKANGEVHIRHQRHRKSVRSHSQSEAATETPTPRTRPTNAD